METTKNRIKKMTELLGITQKDIAQAAHIRESSISNYVNGISEPGQKTLKKIANTFNISASWLMGYGEDDSMYAKTPDILNIPDKPTSFDEMLIAAYHDAPTSTQEIINTLLDLEGEK